MRISRDGLYLVAGVALLLMTPVFLTARQNVLFLNWTDFWVASLVIVGAQVLLIAILAFLFPRRLGLAATVGLTIWFSTFHREMDAALQGLDLPLVGGLQFVAILVLMFPVLLVLLALLPREFITRAIGTAGLALFALAAGELALTEGFLETLEPAIDPSALIDDNPLREPAQARGPLPDIIYIVPDRYTNSGVLAEQFDHDNSGFLDALRQRGFAVADKARANYLKTHYSLASSMNMQYLGPLLQKLDGETRRVQPLYSLIQKNMVAARLKQMGYRYVHLPSWWGGTVQSSQADLIVKFWARGFGGEFGVAVLGRNPFVMLAINKLSPMTLCNANKRQLAYLEEVGGDDQPTFVFTHLLVPHIPIVIDADGNCIPPMDFPGQPSGGTWGEFTDAYSGFVTYLNNRILEIFDHQKANNPNPLIFVVQADEGPFPKAYRGTTPTAGVGEGGTGAAKVDWREANDAQLAMKFGILNALYLGDPDGSRPLPEVPETLTPVNNWRLIFGHLDGKAYPLLPDRYFIYPANDQPYATIEITERLRDIAQ
jgi:hypothetical protein